MFFYIGGNSSVGRARPCQGRGREFESRFPLREEKSRTCSCSSFLKEPNKGSQAQMAELVDACVSGAHAARCAGSSPVLGTTLFDGASIFNLRNSGCKT